MRSEIGAGVFLGMSLMAGVAHGQQVAVDDKASQDIIVTAERRSVSLQRSPLAISALKGDDVVSKGYTSVAQVVQNTPSVVLQGVEGGVSTQSATGGGGAPNIAIRGLGTDGPNKASAVAVYTDGVLIGGGGAFFYDVDRVEVLRGPQGTLYGRGATAGSVNIITNDPTDEWTLSGRLGYGSYNSVNAQLVANAPITNDLSFRVAANVLTRDGYFNNGQSGNGEVNSRAKLLYHPSDTFSVLLGGEYYHADRPDAGTVALSSASPNPTDWETTEPAGGRNKIDYFRIYGRLNWDLGFADLTYQPAFQRNESNAIQYISPGRVTSQSPFDRTFTQELRLVSNATGRFHWIGGIFHYKNTYRYTLFSASPTTSGGIAGYRTTTRRSQYFDQSSVGVFGEADYDISDRVRVTVGGRQNWDEVLHTEYNLTGCTGDLTGCTLGENYFKGKFRKFNWKARLQAQLTDDNLVYASASTGYRPGGSQTNQKYNSEGIRALEIGTKNTIGNWLTINASAFHYKYTGIQMPQAYGVFPALSFTIVNVPARFYGGELEITAKPTSHDTLSFAPVFLHGRLAGDYAYTDPLTGVYSVVATKGKVPPHQPKWSYNASYYHEFDLGEAGTVTAGGDLRYQGRQYTDFDISVYNGANNQIFVQKGYMTGNLSLRYETADKKMGAGLFVTNVGNKIVKVSTAGARTYVNEPRMFGGYFSFNF